MLETRLTKVERQIPAGGLEGIRDVTEASNLALSLFLLDSMPTTLDQWTDIRELVKSEPAGQCLPDPLEDFVAELYRNVYEANPVLAQRYSRRLPERVVTCGSHHHGKY
jgi:hypothetical protein